MTDKELLKTAIDARNDTYTPYSNFTVGAALMTKSGKVYTGGNIENASFTAGICAERVAFFKAINSGEKEFAKIAVAGGKAGEKPVFCSPCGVCRQVMSEFCDDDFEVILGTLDDYKVYKLDEVLPFRFGPKDLS